MMLVVAVCVSGPAFGQVKTVFKGRPEIKISESGIAQVPEQLPRDKAVNLECVISEINGRYYWASRENLELLR